MTDENVPAADDTLSNGPEDVAASAPVLTLGSGSSETTESQSAVDPDYRPNVRGRIDQYGTAMGTGRRKTAVARVRMKTGTGNFLINGRTLEEYFPLEPNQKAVLAPLVRVNKIGKFDITVRVEGGGTTGQSGAVMLGIARALQALDTGDHATLAEGGYLTRDSRMVERKKYGFKKARKSFQFSKR